MAGSAPVVDTNFSSPSLVAGPKPEDLTQSLPAVPATIELIQAVKVTSASELLEKCKTYGLAESAQLLLESREHLLACRNQPSVDGTSLQSAELALLPPKGVAYFMSDIEGRADHVAALIDKERLIERWLKNDPDDQPYLCILGDMIDRSATGSLLLELLLELKCRHGFSRQIIILPGNHELEPGIQMSGENGFFQELVERRESFKEVGQVDAPSVQALIRFCSDRGYFGKHGWEDPTPPNGEEKLIQGRRAVWLMYNEIFQSLPKSISSTNGLFASHAGFPVHGLFAQTPRTEETRTPSLVDLAYLTPLNAERDWSREFNLLVEDISWSDLNPTLDEPSSLTRVGPNLHRGDVGVAFSHAAFDQFARIGGHSLFIRGHQGNPPSHPEVVPIEPGTWVYRNIVTICNGMQGGYAKLDLSISSPTPRDIELDYVYPEPQGDNQIGETGFTLGPSVDFD